MQVIWFHVTGSGNEHGVASWRVSSGGLGDAISGGGYVGVHTSGSENEQNGASAQGAFPLVLTFPVWDAVNEQWDMVVGFAVPHLTNVEAHLWVAVAS